MNAWSKGQAHRVKECKKSRRDSSAAPSRCAVTSLNETALHSRRELCALSSAQPLVYLSSHWRKCSGITGISVSSLFGMRLQYLAVWTVKRQISAQTSINDWFESFRFLSYYSFGPHKLLMVLHSLSASLWFFWPARDFDGTPPISFKDSFIHSTLNFRFTLYR